MKKNVNNSMLKTRGAPFAYKL